jgi:hypothetical protein
MSGEVFNIARQRARQTVDALQQQLSDRVRDVISKYAGRGFSILPGPGLGEITDLCLSCEQEILAVSLKAFTEVLGGPGVSAEVLQRFPPEFVSYLQWAILCNAPNGAFVRPRRTKCSGLSHRSISAEGVVPVA